MDTDKRETEETHRLVRSYLSASDFHLWLNFFGLCVHFGGGFVIFLEMGMAGRESDWSKVRIRLNERAIL